MRDLAREPGGLLQGRLQALSKSGHSDDSSSDDYSWFKTTWPDLRFERHHANPHPEVEVVVARRQGQFRGRRHLSLPAQPLVGCSRKGLETATRLADPG
jgi:hypothetical protein